MLTREHVVGISGEVGFRDLPVVSSRAFRPTQGPTECSLVRDEIAALPTFGRCQLTKSVMSYYPEHSLTGTTRAGSLSGPGQLKWTSPEYGQEVPNLDVSVAA